MIVTNKQLLQLGNNKTEEFVKQSIVFLKTNFKEWSLGKEDSDLKAFIYAIISLGKKYNIVKGINLQKLMHYKIWYNFDISKYRCLEIALLSFGMEEDVRIERFCQYLISGIYKLTPITLDTEIEPTIKPPF